jgi:hypothetical protein
MLRIASNAKIKVRNNVSILLEINVIQLKTEI